MSPVTHLHPDGDRSRSRQGQPLPQVARQTAGAGLAPALEGLALALDLHRDRCPGSCSFYPA